MFRCIVNLTHHLNMPRILIIELTVYLIVHVDAVVIVRSLVVMQVDVKDRNVRLFFPPL